MDCSALFCDDHYDWREHGCRGMTPWPGDIRDGIDHRCHHMTPKDAYDRLSESEKEAFNDKLVRLDPYHARARIGCIGLLQACDLPVHHLDRTTAYPHH